MFWINEIIVQFEWGTAVFTRAFLRRLKPGAVGVTTMWCIVAISLSCVEAFALNPDWQIYQYGHRAWKIEDGFLNSSVSAVADGFLANSA